jgi:hypothetical protein
VSDHCGAIGNVKTRDMKLDIKAYNMGKEREEAFVYRETDETHCSQVLATHSLSLTPSLSLSLSLSH